MEKVSVVLADWQVLFREGIHFTLSGEEGIEVIGEATNSEEAIMVGDTGFEPVTSAMSTQHSNQLS